MLISFSGIDSSGKSTQIVLLRKYCKEHHIITSKIWGKARGTPGVLLIKWLLRRDKKMDEEHKMQYRINVYKSDKKKKILLLASLLDLCWYFGVWYRIRGLFCKYLILDRYLWDTYVEINVDFYGIDIDKMFLWMLVKFLSPKPKLSFMFVIPAEVSLTRDIAKEDKYYDTIELKKAKIDLYMRLVGEGKWTNIIDGMNSIDNIHAVILKTLKIEEEK